MQDPPNGNAGRRRGGRDAKRRAAAVIAVLALVGLAAVGCFSEDSQRPPGEEQRPGVDDKGGMARPLVLAARPD